MKDDEPQQSKVDEIKETDSLVHEVFWLGIEGTWKVVDQDTEVD